MKEFEVMLNGGLGNQLFGWAIGYSVSLDAGFDCRFNASQIEGRSFELEKFRILPFYGKPYQYSELRYEYLSRLLHKLGLNASSSCYREPFFEFDSKFLKPEDKVTYRGYFQSYKYFISNHTIIRDYLLNNFVQSDNFLKAKITIQANNFYAVHVRRGDYISKKNFHGLVNSDYFNRAREMILKNDPSADFLLFSDSPELALAEIPWINYKPQVTDNFPPAETLMLMSATKGIIGSNSSFSWWASYLQPNTAVRIFPKNWFAEKAINTSDLIPKTWFQLDNSFNN